MTDLNKFITVSLLGSNTFHTQCKEKGESLHQNLGGFRMAWWKGTTEENYLVHGGQKSETGGALDKNTHFQVTHCCPPLPIL